MLVHEVRVSWSFGPSEVEATDNVDPYIFLVFFHPYEPKQWFSFKTRPPVCLFFFRFHIYCLGGVFFCKR